MERRGFLRTIGGSALAAMVALAAPADCAQHPRRLLLIELRGGNDALNTVVPFADPTYYRLRPTLAIACDRVLQLDQRVGLHPSLAALMPLWCAGEMAILQGVGCPQPNLSHFRSREIWDSAATTGQPLPVDWIGRAQRRDPRIVCTGLANGGFAGGLLAACESVADQGGCRVIRLTLDGFDTHHDQAPRHAQLLAQLADGLGALRNALREQGRWDSTLVVTHSEFGRRAAENTLGGTDHGAAAVHFAFGGRVRGGFYGKTPTLDESGGYGNPPVGLDFRAVYATVLDHWLGVPAIDVLGGRFRAASFLWA
jgi:uncharacterized protein (DUF1501 family)